MVRIFSVIQQDTIIVLTSDEAQSMSECKIKHCLLENEWILRKLIMIKKLIFLNYALCFLIICNLYA